MERRREDILKKKSGQGLAIRKRRDDQRKEKNSQDHIKVMAETDRYFKMCNMLLIFMERGREDFLKKKKKSGQGLAIKNMRDDQRQEKNSQAHIKVMAETDRCFKMCNMSLAPFPPLHCNNLCSSL